MEKLRNHLTELVNSLAEDDRESINTRLENLISVYPFNEFEFLICSLLGLGKMTSDDYIELRDEYIARNMYLYIFEISSPRGFGERWAQGYLKSLVPNLIKPTKKLDPNYSGQYDLIAYNEDKEIVKIEVKASRAVEFKTEEPLYIKALSSDSDKQFDMNFQQIKPKCCDVFIWVAVWRDKIRFWVLSSKEVEGSDYFSEGQHRGNIGEGQLHLNDENIGEFDKYESSGDKILDAVRNAHKRQIA